LSRGISPEAPVAGKQGEGLRGCPPDRLRRSSSFMPLRPSPCSPATSYALVKPERCRCACLASAEQRPETPGKPETVLQKTKQKTHPTATIPDTGFDNSASSSSIGSGLANRWPWN